MFGCARKLFHTCVIQQAMDLRSLVGHMEAIVSSTRAESWDNVGLLVEPSGNPSVSNVLLTIDLNEQVLSEAKKIRAGLIIAYHPPIFQPLKKLTQHSSKERIIINAIECGIAIYSPHTALDSMEGGVNDWLLSGLGKGNVHALTIHSLSCNLDRILSIHGLHEELVGSIKHAVSRPLVLTTCLRYNIIIAAGKSLLQ